MQLLSHFLPARLWLFVRNCDKTRTFNVSLLIIYTQRIFKPPIIFLFDVFLHVDATKCYISSFLNQRQFARSPHFIEGRLEVRSTTRVKRNFSARGLYFREWLQCSGCQGKTFLVAHGQWPHSLYPLQHTNTDTQAHKHRSTNANNILIPYVYLMQQRNT